MLDGRLTPIDRTVGLFITMNPEYAGRTKLPDNIQSLFRPVAMMVPDAQKILEVKLQSEGFREANKLSKKIVTIFDLMEKVLSKQNHYNYGLRAMKSVVVRAAKLSRMVAPPPAAASADRKESSATSDHEERIVMRAIRDMNASKLIQDDVVLFDNLMNELFPSVDALAIPEATLRAEIESQMVKEGLQVHEYLVNKVLQLYQTQGTRHGNMIVGGSFAGKTTAWKLLQKALTSLSSDPKAGFQPVEVHVLNPQAVSVAELYGYYHPKTREWNEGIFTAILKELCRPETARPGQKWICLDGPVDTLWIESMNTLLDDTKTLTPLNNDRISLTPDVSINFVGFASLSMEPLSGVAAV